MEWECTRGGEGRNGFGNAEEDTKRGWRRRRGWPLWRCPSAREPAMDLCQKGANKRGTEKEHGVYGGMCACGQPPCGCRG